MSESDEQRVTYLNQCQAYENRVGPNPLLASKLNLERPLNFFLALLIPLVSVIVSITLVKLDAPMFVVRFCAIFGIVVSIAFLYICALSLSQVSEDCNAPSDEYMNKLTISFLLSVFVVFVQSMILILIPMKK